MAGRRLASVNGYLERVVAGHPWDLLSIGERLNPLALPLVLSARCGRATGKKSLTRRQPVA